jgi:hypothetical protein
VILNFASIPVRSFLVVAAIRPPLPGLARRYDRLWHSTATYQGVYLHAKNLGVTGPKIDALGGLLIADLTMKGLAIKDDDALVIPVAEEADGKRPLPPLILRKRDGAVTYGTTDLATIFQRTSGEKPAKRILLGIHVPKRM